MCINLFFSTFFKKDIFVKELQPIFEKIMTYFDELICNYDITIATTNASVTNIDSTIIRENLLLTTTAYTSILKGNKKLSGFVSEIIKLIGSSQKLYQNCIATLSKMYLKNHNWFFSTLRSQLLFKLNDTNNQDLMSSLVTNGHSDAQSENIFKFSSIINSCLKEKRIDTKRAKELETIMESKKFEKILP